MNTYEELLPQASEWIRTGGQTALEYLGRAVSSRKSDLSIVTDADHAVQAGLLDAIARHCPDDAVITEETLQSPERHATLSAAKRCWVIDPIDGTRSFSRGFPGFSVSVALMEQGTPVLGLIFNPLTNQLYAATQGGGAWLGENRLRVIEAPLGPDTILAIPSSRRGPLAAPVHRWVDRYVVRNLGSTALHLALLAAGAVDAVYADECKLWDIAAGELLVREAGGRVLDLNSKPYFPMNLTKYVQQETPFLAAGPGALRNLMAEYAPS